MNAAANLREAYKEWRRLAVAEGAAIRTRNWQVVSDCQQALQRLQTRVTELRAAAEPNSRVDDNEVAELIEIGKQNLGRLAKVRETVKQEAEQGERTSRNLRRLRSYVPARPSGWSSIS